jgi:hypothetical protein
MQTTRYSPVMTRPSAAPAPRQAAPGRTARPPKAPPPRKASHAAECEQLEQLPNIGPSIAADLRFIGVAHPRELAGHDAFELYQSLCRATGKRHDPCVLDTFMAATDFMRGAPAKPWWDYTAQRKLQYGQV